MTEVFRSFKSKLCISQEKKIANYVFRSSNVHDYCLSGKKPAKIHLNVNYAPNDEKLKIPPPSYEEINFRASKKVHREKKKFWNWIQKIQTEKQVNLIITVFFSDSLKYRR